MPSIGRLDLGQAVDLNHPTAITYHNNSTGITTAVQPLPRSHQNPDGKLIGLSMMRRDPMTGAFQTQNQVARWKDASPSIRQNLKSRFSMVSPPATPTIPAAHLAQVVGAASSHANVGGVGVAAAVNVESAADIKTDPKTLSAFKVFLKELKRSCPESYRKRYDTLSPGEVVKYSGGGYSKAFFAYHGGKVVGVADYSEDCGFPRGTVAAPNNVVLDQYQGLGVGKKLFQARDAHMRQMGFQHMVGGVYATNRKQIETLSRNGWREMSDSSSDDEMRYFWKALDLRFANIEPRRGD